MIKDQHNHLHMLTMMNTTIQVAFQHLKSFKGADLSALHTRYEEIYALTVHEVVYMQALANSLEGEVSTHYSCIDELYTIKQIVQEVLTHVAIANQGDPLLRRYC